MLLTLTDNPNNYHHINDLKKHKRDDLINMIYRFSESSFKILQDGFERDSTYIDIDMFFDFDELLNRYSPENLHDICKKCNEGNWHLLNDDNILTDNLYYQLTHIYLTQKYLLGYRKVKFYSSKCDRLLTEKHI